MQLIRLIRLPNLLMLALCQVIIRYGFYLPSGADYGLDHVNFGMLVLSCIFLAAGGYIINDLSDKEIDRVNKKNRPLVTGMISDRSAFAYYMIFTILGVGGGFYMANLTGYPAYAGIFVAIAALLYLYATMLSSMLLIGNLLISVLVGFSLLVVLIFDLLPVTDWSNRSNQQWFFQTVLLYSGWSFGLNLLREWVKDLEDMDGDQNGGRQTLPVVLGRRRTIGLITIGTVVLIVSLLYQLYFEWYSRTYLVLYFLALIIGPLIFFAIKIQGAKSSSDYRKASLLLKFIMLIAICSIAMLNINN